MISRSEIIILIKQIILFSSRLAFRKDVAVQAHVSHFSFRRCDIARWVAVYYIILFFFSSFREPTRGQRSLIGWKRSCQNRSPCCFWRLPTCLWECITEAARWDTPSLSQESYIPVFNRHSPFFHSEAVENQLCRCIYTPIVDSRAGRYILVWISY